MKDYSPQIFGPILGSEDYDLLSAQIDAALGKRHHKKKGGKNIRRS